jgi:hypothetical protein
MVHPEVGTWVKGKPYRERSEWGTKLDTEGDDVLADVDRNTFWEMFTQWK